MNKRITSLLLALVMILGLVPGMSVEASAGDPFTDVPEGSFYEEPILWALENGITTGTSATTFDPGGVCQRAAVVTFLWRAAGMPDSISDNNPFVDVRTSDFFYEAVLWAVEKGITNGSDETHFNPYGVCDRAQVVTFLYRAKGSPASTDADLPFNDVPAGAWFAAPVAWAVESGITNGLSATKFGPNVDCNRAQVVTFLYRAYFVKKPVCTHAGLQAFEANAPTCTEPGNTACWYCADCGKYFDNEEATSEIGYDDTIIAATGHTPDAQTACTEDQVCTVCGEVLAAATGHDPGDEATCTEDQVCTVCGEVLAAATGHDPGDEATCTEGQVCTVCGEVLATANGHIPGAEATCTEPQRCLVCQTVLAEATGHSLTYVEARDPVDDKDLGNRAYWQCSVCGKCYLDEAATKEIAHADTAWEIYLIHFYDLENGTHTVGAYKQSEALFLKNITPVEMKGYDFNGWHTSTNFTPENKILVIPAGNTQNMNLYANRSLHKYKVTLLGLGREEAWSYDIANGIQLTTPKWKESAELGVDCLIFSHWSDEKGNKITQIPAGEIGDRTIEANWIYKENYAISNPDKYTYVGGVSDQDGKYSFIYEVGAIKNIVLSKQHDYLFNGLIEHTESENKTYSVGASEGREAATTISEIISSSTDKTDIKRYTTTHNEGWEAGAKWKPEVEFKGIKVRAWEFSGGYSESDTDTYEKAGFITEKNYKEDGTENEIRSTVDYYTEQSVSKTVSDTFIPGVTPVGTYTWARMMDVKVYAIVTYNPYTGKYVFDVHSVPTYIYDGFLYTPPGNLEYEVNIVSGDVLDFDIPFEDIPKMFYTVEYDANGGTGEMHKSVHELGVSSKLLPRSYTLKDGEEERIYGFAKTGYTFNRWTTSPDGTGQAYTDGFIISSDIAAAGENVTLYAQWIPNTYKVYYDANGGTGTMEPSEHTYDVKKKLSANAFSRTGYTLLGWSEEKNATAAKYLPNESVENLCLDPDGEVILYAVWDGNTYTVTYDGNGGTGTTGTTDHKYGTPSNLAKNEFTRTEYTFLGWSTDPNDTVPEFTAEQEVKTLATEGNVTLYAVWVRTEATVTISGIKTVTEDDEVYDSVGIPLAWSQLTENKYTTLEVSISTYGEDGAWNGFDPEDEWLIWVYDYGMTKELHFHNFGDKQGEATTIKTDFTVSISDIENHGILIIEWGAGGAANDTWVRNGVTVKVKAKK